MGFEAIRLQTWYTTAQGKVVAEVLGEALTRWLAQESSALDTLGLGFCQPYLPRLAEAARSLVGASPAEMGVAPWPGQGRNRIALVRPDALPFADETFDRVVLTHFLEGVVHTSSALRETWRVLRPGGRLLVITPNRGGLWARRDATPFGWGQPFSPTQLRDLLQDSLFVTRQASFALFLPSFFQRRFLTSARTWEKVGQRWFAPLGGVILCEAEKVVYATTPLTSSADGLRRARKVVLPVAERSPGTRRENYHE